MPKVAVVIGSKSDSENINPALETLTKLGIDYEIKVISAHRNPEKARQYGLYARENGIEVIIAGAGWAAHLAGFMAAHTTLPVIGVPIDSSAFKGLDALLSTVQMPPGIPVATVAVGSGGAKNAGVLAAQILALKYPPVAEKLKDYRAGITNKAKEKADAWKK